MRFESRVFTLAKDGDRAGENQDASWVDAARRRAAIADGVSSAIFSRAWARILAEAAVVDPPDPLDRQSLARWLADNRELWTGQIDTSNLAWHQKPKLRDGAFSTLLWVTLIPDDVPPGGWRLRAFAIGDSCLFHVRNGATLAKFPVQCAAELDNYPVVVGSLDLSRDSLIQFTCLERPYESGDLIVLCTDALAEWALKRDESGDPPVWDDCWLKDERQWQDEIQGLRDQRQIRYDDTTLILIRLLDQTAGEEPASAAAATGEGGPSEDEHRPEDSTLAQMPSGEVILETLRHVSHEVREQLSEQVARGVEKLHEVKQTTGERFRKVWDRLRKGR